VVLACSIPARCVAFVASARHEAYQRVAYGLLHRVFGGAIRRHGVD
jgi:hypothetical protein